MPQMNPTPILILLLTINGTLMLMTISIYTMKLPRLLPKTLNSNKINPQW